jgi:hypothetical protein
MSRRSRRIELLNLGLANRYEFALDPGLLFLGRQVASFCREMQFSTEHRFRDAFLHPRSGGDARDFAGSTRVGARFGSIVNSVVSRIGSGLRAAVQFGGSACTKKNRRAGAQNRGDVCEHQ